MSEAWRHYLDSGSLADAARSSGIHPKTIQKHARRLRWPQRREKILEHAAAIADRAAAQQIGQAEADAATSWRELLATATSRRALLEILRSLKPR